METSSVSWGTPGGPLRIVFGMRVTGPDRFAAAPNELRVLNDVPAAGPEPKWLEIVADGRPLFSGPLVHRTPYGDDAGMVFHAGVKEHAQVVARAWTAKSLRARFFDVERRPLGEATFFLPPPERRAAPISAAFARAQARFGDPKVCSARYRMD